MVNQNDIKKSIPRTYGFLSYGLLKRERIVTKSERLWFQGLAANINISAGILGG